MREDMTTDAIPEEGAMPRIIVTTDPTSDRSEEPPVLLDERVYSVHLSDGHAAEQLIQRLAWAVNDAEDTQREPAVH
jgi:hypothetical protein